MGASQYSQVHIWDNILPNDPKGIIKAKWKSAAAAQVLPEPPAFPIHKAGILLLLFIYDFSPGNSCPSIPAPSQGCVSGVAPPLLGTSQLVQDVPHSFWPFGQQMLSNLWGLCGSKFLFSPLFLFLSC